MMRTTDAVVKLAAIRVVKDAVAAAEEDAKTWLAGEMDPGDRKNAVVDDGASVGTVSYSKTSAKALVHDRAAFTAWATDAHPTEVRIILEVDADDLMAAFLYLTGEGQATGHADAYNRLMAKIRSGTPQVRKAFEAEVLAQVVKAKAAVDTRTGEVIPGVTYVPGGDAGYISMRQSDEQRDALLEAWRRGDLDHQFARAGVAGDLLTVVTTPIAELDAPPQHQEPVCDGSCGDQTVHPVHTEPTL